MQMTEETAMRWSLLGKRPVPPSPSWLYVVLAFLLAVETFLVAPDVYPLYMAVAVIAAGAWASYTAIAAKSLFGLTVLPVALLWLNPIFGGDWFTSLNAMMFLSHSAMAMMFALVAYTHLARERRPK
jgi:hypothetical protein